MSENDTPARRLTDAEMAPKAKKPRNTKGLVLKGKKHVVKPITLLDDGTPDLPHPRGLKHAPARTLTPEQMADEPRERGGVAAELQRTRKDP